MTHQDDPGGDPADASTNRQAVTELVQQGVDAHRNGRLADAIALYRQALAREPEHLDALHMLGVALAQQSDYPEAIALLRKVVHARPRFGAAYVNLGNAQRDAGLLDDAVASFDRALQINPSLVSALCGRASALQQLNRPADAIASCDAALRMQPNRFEAHYFRGNSLARLGRFQEAIAAYDKALQLKPDLWDALFHRGAALLDLRQPKLALASFDEALRHRPDNARTLNIRGVVLRRLGSLPDALSSLERAIAAQPDYGDAYVNQGAVLFDMQALERSLASYGRALQIAPDNADALCGYGTVLQELGRLTDALRYFDRALAVAPDHPETHNNRGKILLELGQWTDALASFERAVRAKPDYTMAHVNLGMCRLLLGDLRLGWKEIEWRRRWLIARRVRPDIQAPDWDGSQPLRNKTILLWSEQGAGDVIQFCRFVPVLAAQGAKVILRAYAGLRELLAGLDGLERVVSGDEPLPAVDYQIPLLSLPLALGIDQHTVPTQPGYLRAAPQRVSAWTEKLGPRRMPSIGVAWSGSSGHINDSHRSMPLQQFVRIVQDGCEFICLQNSVRPEDRPALAQSPIREFCADLSNFQETAALIQHMDLVITVDTSVAHLAGALGRPVWILLPFAPDWRWMLHREDSPWYPTARLFRQPQRGDWDSVLDRVHRTLSGTRIPVGDQPFA